MKILKPRAVPRVGGCVLALLVVMLHAKLAGAKADDDQPQALSLWPDAVSGNETLPAESERQFVGQRIVQNVTQPVLIPYLADPELNTGIAVIIAPGGGFRFLAIDQEGTLLAEWLNQRGINAFVLKYRLEETPPRRWCFSWKMFAMFTGAALKAPFSSANDYPKKPFSPVQELAINDGLKALALVRRHADEWNLRGDAIGILGFSAGGAVATGVAINAEGDSRPDFVASIYGVPAMGEPPPDAPPLFVLAAKDDPIVPAQWSQNLHQRWQAAGHHSTLQLYDEGGHGFGMARRGLPVDHWTEQLHRWLKARW